MIYVNRSKDVVIATFSSGEIASLVQNEGAKVKLKGMIELAKTL
jgi:hypothetical protein